MGPHQRRLVPSMAWRVRAAWAAKVGHSRRARNNIIIHRQPTRSLTGLEKVGRQALHLSHGELVVLSNSTVALIEYYCARAWDFMQTGLLSPATILRRVGGVEATITGNVSTQSKLAWPHYRRMRDALAELTNSRPVYVARLGNDLPELCRAWQHDAIIFILKLACVSCSAQHDNRGGFHGYNRVPADAFEAWIISGAALLWEACKAVDTVRNRQMVKVCCHCCLHVLSGPHCMRHSIDVAVLEETQSVRVQILIKMEAKLVDATAIFMVTQTLRDESSAHQEPGT